MVCGWGCAESNGFSSSRKGASQLSGASSNENKRTDTFQFNQNRNLRLELFRTGDSILVECSFNCRWGAGLPLDHPNLKRPDLWPGRNYLGRMLQVILDRMREHIKFWDELRQVEAERGRQAWGPKNCKAVLAMDEELIPVD